MSELKCEYATCGLPQKGENLQQAIDLLKMHYAAIHYRAPEAQGVGEIFKKEMDRPKISEESTEVEWKAFINDWGRYKSSQNVTRTVDIHNELLSCCSEEVRENLDWARGVKIDNLDEKALITAIKKAAVYSISKSIHRRNFHQMNQEADKNSDHKRAEYKNQQAAGQRGGETSKKFETGSKGKCTDCNKTFNNVISVRGKQRLIHKCQTCFKKSARCKKCDETGHR